VAALLHLESTNLPSETQAWQARGDKPISSDFKEAAGDRLDAVIQASLASSDNRAGATSTPTLVQEPPSLTSIV
jgi:hypothetical protein